MKTCSCALMCCLACLAAVAFSQSCERSSTSSGGSSTSSGGTSTPSTTTYSYSEKARKVRTLIDAGSYLAAETMLDATLPSAPDDAGLYIQYARVVILSRNWGVIFGDTVSIPGLNLDWYSGRDAVSGMLKLAVQYDPHCRSHAANEILATVHNYARGRLDTDGGIVPVGSGAEYTDAVWIAATVDPEVGKRWALKFEDMIPVAVKHAKPFSTFRLAHLVVTLRSGAPNPDGFKLINASVLKSIRAAEPGVTFNFAALQDLYANYCEGLNAEHDSEFGDIARYFPSR